MGRTLLGVDLDGSPAGTLLERLLSDEDLAKLADGGRPDGDGGQSRSPGGAGGTTTRAGKTDAADETRAAGGTDESETDCEASDGGVRERLAGLRPLLLKAAVALTVLAVLAVVAWRYLRRVAAAVPTPDRFGGASGTDDGNSDEPPARRRAKVAGADEGGVDAGFAVGAGASGRPDQPADTTSGGGRSSGRESESADLGALVALATLALIAALVRKFGEGTERDPLVDGPARE